MGCRQLQIQDFFEVQNFEPRKNIQKRKLHIQSSSGSLNYTYDIEGRTTQVQSPEGTINYDYDVVTGRKTRTWTTNSDQRYTYDELGRLASVSVHKRDGIDLATPETTTYSYTAVGSRESVELPNGVLTEYHYDQLNRLTSLAHYNATDELLASYSYALAPNGRRTAVHEQRLEPDSTYSTTNISYQYDGLNRLTSETSVSSVVNLNYSSTYNYNLCGNRIRKTSATSAQSVDTLYYYNQNDQLTSEASNVKGNTLYQYDDNGSLTTKSNATTGENCTYAYNLQNRLSEATINRLENSQPVSISATYAYNQNGIRVRADSTTTIDGLTTDNHRIFLVDSQNHTGYAQVLEEMATIGATPSVSYVIGDDVLSQSSALGVRHFAYDGHGSTRMLTSANGTVTSHYDYDAYGISIPGNPNLANPAATDFLYSGEQFDAGLQNYYNRARYYDPANGQWNRLDPFMGNTSDPQSLHKYTYCHDDPVNGIDPSGNMFFSIVSTLASATIGISLDLRYNLAVYKSGTRGLERVFRGISNFWIRNWPKDRDNATIVVHGVAPHEYTYSEPFRQELASRAPDQDYYEFVWSGFALTGGVVPNMISHDVAVDSLREAMITLRGKGYRNINIIAHSWGTVISRDVLLGGVGPVNTWFTMGAPLPASTPWPGGLQNWVNIFSPFDPIIYLGPVLGATGVGGGTGFLFNRDQVYQVGTFEMGFFGSHSMYWTDSRTLNTIGERLNTQ